MITYTAWPDIEITKDLYKEWVGKEPEFKRTQPNSHLIIARESGGRIVGAAQLITIDDPIWDRRWATVENIYVAEDHRRLGIATRLMEELESKARSLGCKFIKFTAQPEAIKALHRKRGYNECTAFGKGLS